MADFCEVIRQIVRHAGVNGVREIEIILTSDDGVKTKIDGRAEEIEKEIMRWADENPEMRYPTWAEWWAKTYPEFDVERFCAHTFDDGRCLDYGSCDKHHDCEMPADIAEKMGIKPVSVKRQSTDFAQACDYAKAQVNFFEHNLKDTLITNRECKNAINIAISALDTIQFLPERMRQVLTRAANLLS